jgi:predicted ATPase/class 3 adenylate cyclase/DNA-binding CsgD family transcriptional regulator
MTSDGSASSLVHLQRPIRWGATGVTSPEHAFSLPVGTVTFLLSDVEGSTRLWQSEPAEVMRVAVARHYALLADIVERHGGVRPQEQGEGDSIVAAFARPSEALQAALEAQQALHAEPWTTSAPLRVRMAIHTGEAQLRDEANYAGQAIIRTARLRALGHGGQVLVSGATRDLAVDQLGDAVGLRFLGEHRLRDLGRVEQVWQLAHPDLPDDFAPLASIGAAEATPHNLPSSLSPFIGRVAEIVTLSDLVNRERLVTATGSGGAGKTRLAQQVGAELLDAFPAGVWWMELAPVSGAAVEELVRSVLGIGHDAAVPLEEAMRRRLDGRRGLIIFDNCEHVAAEVAPLVDRLLRASSTLHVLATSRVMLDLPGELAWRIPPLSLPDRSTTVPLDVLSQFDAVGVFCDRARRARPNFRLTDDNGPAVAELCHRLDGIPLAIELAAARTRLMSPSQILDGLDDALRLLSGGSRAVLPRQQTLEASIEWSYRLLAEHERVLFRRLAVFANGWTLDAAEGVCADDILGAHEVFDALDRLVDHSLVHVDDTNTGTRFRMLETVRHYATRQLGADSDEQAAVRAAHAGWFAHWLVGFEERVQTNELPELLPLLDSETDNVAGAFGYLIVMGHFDDAARMLTTMFFSRSGGNEAVFVRQTDQLMPFTDAMAAEGHSDVLFLRAGARIGIGEIGGAFADLELAENVAESAGYQRGRARARGFRIFLLLFAVGSGDMNELEECRAELVALGDSSWAAAFDYFMVMLANHGSKVSDTQRLLERAKESVNRSGMTFTRVGLMASEGLLRIQVGRPTEAVDLLLTVCRSRHQGTMAWCGSAFWAVQAGFLCGRDVWSEVIPAIEQLERIEANPHAAEALCLARSWRAAASGDLAELVALQRAWRNAQDDDASTDGLDPELTYLLEAVGACPPEFAERRYPTTDFIQHSAALRTTAARVLNDGDPSAALDAAHTALAFEAEYELPPVLTLELVARILIRQGSCTDAARLLGACEAARSERTLVRLLPLQQLANADWNAIRTALGDEATDAAATEGATLSLEAAAEFASRLRVGKSRATVGWDALTPTERRVADLVAEGRTNAEVAKELLMGPETVKTHLSRVYAKLGVRNRKDLLLAAARR